MKKLHYYQVLLLLGSLLTAPLHAAKHNQDDQKYPEEQQPPSAESFYEHGDITFIQKGKNKIDLKELKQGLIELSSQIKAMDGRKVFFFIGSTGVGKSLSIMALQGNKIKKIEKESSDSEDSDDSFCENPDSQKNQAAKAKFDIQYVLPKEEVPVVGHGAIAGTVSTFIYYPDPKKPQYNEIAFADTEGFFGKRKATNAGKCLSAVSFFYATKVNKVGGVVIVISVSELDANRGKGLENIAYILQEYFAKPLSKQQLKESVLVMITKVREKEDRTEAFLKFRQCIQLFYQEYYTSPDSEEILQKSEQEVIKLARESKSLQKKLEEERKKRERGHRLKRFFEMLLKQDVPKDQINDINNFKLDGKRFCFIFPWKEKNIQKILNKKLSQLKPINASDLCTFNNPVSQYMEARIRDFGTQLDAAIQPMLSLKQAAHRMKRKIEKKMNAKAISKAIEVLEKNKRTVLDWQIRMKKDNRLAVVFEQSHYENIISTQATKNFGAQWKRMLFGYSAYKAFQYEGGEPIYQIVATYGPEAEITENLPFWDYLNGRSKNFIATYFTITAKKDDKGSTIWKAVSKNGNGVTANSWLLYHVVTGKGAHKAQCTIKFYAYNKDRIATHLMIKQAEKKKRLLEKEIAGYSAKREDYNTLESKYKVLSAKLVKKRDVQIKKWQGTVEMLQFFVDEILKKRADKKLLKCSLSNFKKAIELQSSKINNPKSANQLDGLIASVDQDISYWTEAYYSHHYSKAESSDDDYYYNEDKFPDDDYMMDSE